MSYRVVTNIAEIPVGSKWLGDGKGFVQEGQVSGWGYQEPYGKEIIMARYSTPKGELIALEKYVLSRVTKAEAWASLKAAGY